MNSLSIDRLARQVAHAAGTFEHLLLGRAPTSVSVVADRDWMVVHLHEPFSPVDLDLFLLGDGLPALGVPVNVHRHVTATNGPCLADGIGAVRA